MPNRLSKILSRSSKEKEAEAEVERNNSSSTPSPPPEYAQNPPDYDHDNVLDPPDITAGFNNLNLNSQASQIPQVNQCIAHLKVLECFYRLRQEIGSTDGLFGIENSIVTNSGLASNDKAPEVLAKLSEKRWAVYVSRAVDRFETWSASIIPAACMITGSQIDDLGKRGLLCEPSNTSPPLNLDRNSMPPVDVLMVWHAYMLNPRSYLEDCLRLGRMSMWHSGMPWQAAVDCINSETFADEAGECASKNFNSLTGLPWDNLENIYPRLLDCPGCSTKLEVPYTTCAEDISEKPRQFTSWDDLSSYVDELLSSGTGFCDKNFATRCSSCQSIITHESLRGRKFCNDLERLHHYDVPMGGTILGIEGLPVKFGSIKDPSYSQACKFPNRLLQGELGQKMLQASSKVTPSVDSIRDVIEKGLKPTHNYVRTARQSISSRMVRTERMSIRRMMSRYWDNSSPFALDLVGAVIRQGSFIEKMHNIDWLHSPALPSTMKRVLVKYQRFVDIMRDPMNMAVPTLDVDLAWHTHQLSPYSYMEYTVNATGRQFIDHDDKIAETKLNDAFAWTSKTYQKQYGEPYSECTCWYCEAVRESHTNPVSRLFNSRNIQANEKLHDADQDPRKSVHISTHNAVRPDDETYQKAAAKKAQQLEKEYQKACERARKKGRKPPKRDDYYYSDAWGYPVYMPAYSPYLMFYAYTPMYYAATPGCMALGAGTAGNCAAGTCGGGVASGSCGGAGGAACAGGAGGCAGGAGAGCAGGGGGCGGGGGGGCGGGGGGG